MNNKETKIFDALEGQAKKRDIEIVAVEAVGSRKSPIIRIYIDTPSGVSFQDLTDAQEWIGEVLDVLDPFPGAYTMEVSSPGIDRPLRTPEHFKRFIGEEAKVTLAIPMDGRANFKGIIKDAGEDSFKLECEGKEMDIPYNSAKKANLIGKIEF